MTDKEYNQLRRCILFRTVEDKVLHTLLDRDGVSEKSYQARQIIYSPTVFTKSVGIVLSGSAAVEKRAGNASMLMSILREGDVFGAATVLCDSDIYPVNIRALAPTNVLIIPENAFLAALREDFSLAEQYMRYLTGRIRFLSSRIDGFAQPSADERLYTFLKNNAVEGCVTLGFPVKALADALCIGRATLYRAFDALEEQGRIRREGRTIRLL